MRIHAKNLISICGHLGTHKFNWQPESERFAIGYRSSVLIYNLSNSSFYLSRALAFVEKLVLKYGRTYVYGLHHERDKKWIKKFSFINQVVATETWKGGYVTNARTFRGKVKNVNKRFAAVIGLNYDYQNYSLPREAHIINIPAICPVDSNVQAENFAYPIPINSTSVGGMRMLAYIFGLHIFKGLSKRIVSRFSKKKKIIKLKSKKKQSILKSKYFKKIRKLLSTKKVKAKRKLQKWIKKFRKIKYKERREVRFKKQRKLFRQNKIKPKRVKISKRKKANSNATPKKLKDNKNYATNKLNRKKYKKINKNRRFHRAQNKRFKRRGINSKRNRFRRASRISRFTRIKQKLQQLKKMKLFQKVLKSSRKHKTSRFFFRRFKKTVTAYKYVNIYTYLRGKKNKLLKLKNLKKRRQRLYQKKKQEKSKKRYRYFYYNNMFIKKLKKKKSYFPML